MSKEMKFYIDERCGCIAVRERIAQDVSNGCHPDLIDVIAFWQGTNSFDGNGQIMWSVADWQREKAASLCAKLNAEKDAQ